MTRSVASGTTKGEKQAYIQIQGLVSHSSLVVDMATTESQNNKPPDQVNVHMGPIHNHNNRSIDSQAQSESSHSICDDCVINHAVDRTMVQFVTR